MPPAMCARKTDVLVLPSIWDENQPVLRIMGGIASENSRRGESKGAFLN